MSFPTVDEQPSNGAVVTFAEVVELNRLFLEEPTRETFDAFEHGAKLYYGEEGYKKCKEFFLTFGGADMYDFMFL